MNQAALEGLQRCARLVPLGTQACGQQWESVPVFRDGPGIVVEGKLFENTQLTVVLIFLTNSAKSNCKQTTNRINGLRGFFVQLLMNTSVIRISIRCLSLFTARFSRVFTLDREMWMQVAVSSTERSWYTRNSTTWR